MHGTMLWEHRLIFDNLAFGRVDRFFFFYESKNEGIGTRERGEEEEVATRSTFARFKIAT